MMDFDEWWEKESGWGGELLAEGVLAKEAWQAASDHYEEKLNRLREWAKAYPLEIFPEPDFKKVREVLEKKV